MSHLRPIANPQDAEALMGLRRSLRVATVAQVLDMDPSQVRKLLAAGELEGHRAGKRGLRIYEDSVDAYRRRQHVGPRPVETAEPRPRRRSGPSAAAREALAALRAAGVFD